MASSQQCSTPSNGPATFAARTKEKKNCSPCSCSLQQMVQPANAYAYAYATGFPTASSAVSPHCKSREGAGRIRAGDEIKSLTDHCDDAACMHGDGQVNNRSGRSPLLSSEEETGDRTKYYRGANYRHSVPLNGPDVGGRKACTPQSSRNRATGVPQLLPFHGRFHPAP